MKLQLANHFMLCIQRSYHILWQYIVSKMQLISSFAYSEIFWGYFANKMSETSINSSINLCREILHEAMIPQYLHPPTLAQEKEEAALFAQRYPPRRHERPNLSRQTTHLLHWESWRSFASLGHQRRTGRLILAWLAQKDQICRHWHLIEPGRQKLLS